MFSHVSVTLFGMIELKFFFKFQLANSIKFKLKFKIITQNLVFRANFHSLQKKKNHRKKKIYLKK